MKPAAVLIALAITTSAVACGSGDDAASPSPTRPAATGTPMASTASATPEATGTEGPAAATPTTVASPPSPQPAQPTLAPPPPPTQPPAAFSLTVAAVNTAFAPTRLSAATGATVTVTIDNQDAGVLHDFVLFDLTGARIAETELFEGLGARSVTFTAPGPGNYPFTCTVHPQDMRGTLTVQ